MSDKSCLSTPFVVFNHLSKLKANKVYGPDGLYPVFLREMALFLADPLSNIFNASWTSGIFTSAWKILCHTRCGQKTLTANDYRPISLLNIISKVHERITLNLLTISSKNHIYSNFGENQYGFRPGSSTTHAIVAIHDKLTSDLDKVLLPSQRRLTASIINY